MSLSRAYTALWICFMIGSKENPTLDVCWLVFCVIMIIKTFSFLLFRILADISVLLISAIIKIW